MEIIFTSEVKHYSKNGTDEIKPKGMVTRCIGRVDWEAAQYNKEGEMKLTLEM